MRFEFATSARIVFGRGTFAEIGAIAREFGDRALVAAGTAPETVERLRQLLSAAGVTAIDFPVMGEPTVETVRAGADLVLRENCRLIVGLGGGSAIDTAKAIAALAANGGDPLDYMEVIGKGKSLTMPSLPVIAVPTTAGTGAEVTKNAVIGSPEHRVKVSLRSATMLPRVALVDPELTLTLPPNVTASTGMDALTQTIEPFLSNFSNPLTDSLCLEGMQRAARSLRKAFENGADIGAREDMALTSMFGGIALANARLGAVHGFAGPIGGMFPAPHGAVCGRLLPAAMRVNIAALKACVPENPALKRCDEMARILTGNPHAAAEDGATWIERLATDLALPGLSAYGITAADFPALVELSTKASSMRGNPIVLTENQMADILAQSL